jgi:hypothetical protein
MKTILAVLALTLSTSALAGNTYDYNQSYNKSDYNNPSATPYAGQSQILLDNRGGTLYDGNGQTYRRNEPSSTSILDEQLDRQSRDMDRRETKRRIGY